MKFEHVRVVRANPVAGAPPAPEYHYAVHPNSDQRDTAIRETAGRLVDVKAKQYQQQHGGDYSAAVRAVLKADPKLAEQYLGVK